LRIFDGKFVVFVHNKKIFCFKLGFDMENTTLWWVITGSAVVLELMTGTFYLLMLAVGSAAAALAAHAGASFTTQIVVGAFAGGVTVAGWYKYKKNHRTEPTAQANHNVLLDIGETVNVLAWNPDGTAQIQYRGAQWTAIHRPGILPQTGMHRVAEFVGNRLLVDKT
jgi:membrane protein implicated in regulation of membrane protease activity